MDEKGNFTSNISGGRSRFLTVADQLLSGRRVAHIPKYKFVIY